MIKRETVERRITKTKKFKTQAKQAVALVKAALEKCDDLPVFVHMTNVDLRLVVEHVAHVFRTDGEFSVEVSVDNFTESWKLKIW